MDIIVTFLPRCSRVQSSFKDFLEIFLKGLKVGTLLCTTPGLPARGDLVIFRALVNGMDGWNYSS